MQHKVVFKMKMLKWEGTEFKSQMIQLQVTSSGLFPPCVMGPVLPSSETECAI